MTTIHDDPPTLTTQVDVQHLIPIGSKFKATHGVERVGTVLAVVITGAGPSYKVAYDDEPAKFHHWDLRNEVRWTWWSPDEKEI